MTCKFSLLLDLRKSDTPAKSSPMTTNFEIKLVIFTNYGLADCMYQKAFVELHITCFEIQLLVLIPIELKNLQGRRNS